MFVCDLTSCAFKAVKTTFLLMMGCVGHRCTVVTSSWSVEDFLQTK